MAFNLGTVFLTFKSKQEGFKETQHAIQGTSGAVNETIKHTANLGRQLAGVAGSIVAGFVSAKTAVDVFKNAADFEQTRIGLENMLGSADRARSVLSEVSKFAAETPFEFPELAGSVRQLVAFGFSAEDAISTMKQLGDVSAAVGAPIGDLSYLMGTLRTQGRAFTVDIRQFAQRGIPIYEYLAKVLKTNEQAISTMIEEGKIGFPEVQKAFQAMTAEGGKFHGTMEKQSKSVSGMLSTMKDNLFAAGRAFLGLNEQGDIAAGSILARMKDAIVSLNGALQNAAPFATAVANSLGMFIDSAMQAWDALANYFLPKITELWEKISNNLLPVLMRLWNEVLLPLVPVIGTLLVGAVSMFIDVLNTLVPIIANVMNWILDNKEAVMVLVGALIALKAALMITSAIEAVRLGFEALRLVTIPALITSINGIGPALAALGVPFAVFAAGAVAAVAVVTNAFSELDKTINDTKRAISDAQYSNTIALQRAKEQYQQGKITKERYNAIIKQANEPIPSFASGVTNFSGGLAFVHRGEALVNMAPGTTVVPEKQVAAATQGGGNTYHIHLSGIMARSDSELADIMESGIQALDRRLSGAGKKQIMGSTP